MSTAVDLKKIEQKIFTSYFHDGLWDIYGGMILAGFGLTMLTGQIMALIGLVTVAVVILMFRKRLVIPRMGSVTFSAERVARTKRSRAIAMTVLTLTFLLGLVLFALFSLDEVPPWLRSWMADYFLAAFGGILALMVSAAAYMVGIARYQAYAGLVLLAFILANFLDVHPGLPVTIAGGIILLCGAYLFIRFLRKYPLPAGEETDGQA
jgi:hypothetical protein